MTVGCVVTIVGGSWKSCENVVEGLWRKVKKALKKFLEKKNLIWDSLLHFMGKYCFSVNCSRAEMRYMSRVSEFLVVDFFRLGKGSDAREIEIENIISSKLKPRACVGTNTSMSLNCSHKL